MSTRLSYLGVAGYEIVGPTQPHPDRPVPLARTRSRRARPDDLERPDVILVSHAAYDHYGDTAAIARRTGAPVVCDAATCARLLIDRRAAAGPDPADHLGNRRPRGRRRRYGPSSATTGRGDAGDGADHGHPIAFIVETEPGIRIYHYGDTAIFDMRLFGELYAPTVGIFGAPCRSSSRTTTTPPASC